MARIDWIADWAWGIRSVTAHSMPFRSGSTPKIWSISPSMRECEHFVEIEFFRRQSLFFIGQLSFFNDSSDRNRQFSRKLSLFRWNCHFFRELLLFLGEIVTFQKEIDTFALENTSRQHFSIKVVTLPEKGTFSWRNHHFSRCRRTFTILSKQNTTFLGKLNNFFFEEANKLLNDLISSHFRGKLIHHALIRHVLNSLGKSRSVHAESSTAATATLTSIILIKRAWMVPSIQINKFAQQILISNYASTGWQIHENLESVGLNNLALVPFAALYNPSLRQCSLLLIWLAMARTRFSRLTILSNTWVATDLNVPSGRGIYIGSASAHRKLIIIMFAIQD